MAGMRAALFAPTWPDINGAAIPPGMDSMSPLMQNLVYNPITVQFIHRGLAYLLFILIVIGWLKSRKINGSPLFRNLWTFTGILIFVQVLLGILTLLNAAFPDRLVWLGVSHQFTGMLLAMMITSLLFVTRSRFVISR